MEKKCKNCGIYEILHDKMNHDFVEEEALRIVNEERKFAFDRIDYLMKVNE